jgi:flagellar motor switch protein FliN
MNETDTAGLADGVPADGSDGAVAPGPRPEHRPDPAATAATTAHAQRPYPTSAALEAVYNVPVQVAAVLGRTTMPVSQLLRLGRGAVVKLDRRVGEPIDIYVNNRLVARGEVMVVDEQLTVTMTEIIRGES